MVDQFRRPIPALETLFLMLRCGPSKLPFAAGALTVSGRNGVAQDEAAERLVSTSGKRLSLIVTRRAFATTLQSSVLIGRTQRSFGLG